MTCAGCDDCNFDGRNLPTNFHEIHLTVKVEDKAEMDHFIDVCKRVNVKAIIVAYNKHDDSTKILDPMTSHKFVGTEDGALEAAREITMLFLLEDIEVIRTKIETTPTNPICEIGEGYYESHIGITLDKSRIDSLRKTATWLGLHVSNNAFKEDGDVVTMMLTKREDGKAYSSNEFTNLMHYYVTLLNTYGYASDKLIVEYCWFDSNKQHDENWMGK